MKKIKFVILLISLVLFLQHSFAQKDASKHVILIGINGISAESFQYANIPVLNNLISQGVISLKTRGVMPLESVPNWVSILSGAGPEQHGVTSNNWSLGNQGLEPTDKDADGYFPSIFTLIRKQMPKATTAIFYDWDWLSTYVNKKYISKEQYIQGQVMVTSVALNYIKKEKPLFTFIYYGVPGETGKAKGFASKDYLQSINVIDTEIGKLMDGIKEAGIAQNTTIIITSNPAKTGIGNTENNSEIEVPWIISGAGIKKNFLLETPNDLMNTSPTIARIIGLKTPPEWIGKPVNEVFISKFPTPKANKYIAKPFCSLAEGAYSGPQQIELSTTAQNAEVNYTLDGKSPGIYSKKYTSPFTINSNCILKAVAVSGENISQVTSRTFTFSQGIITATLKIQPAEKHSGSGVSGLFDGLIGSSNPNNKQWMGYEGEDFEITINLGEVKAINSLGIDVLQMPSASVFLPSAVEFYVSDDNKSFRLLNTFYPAETDDIRLDGPVMLARNFNAIKSQYVRIKATNIGLCPPTTPGEGQKAWLLISEVEIE